MSDPLRFFVSAESMQESHVEITGDTFHHLRNVLRVKPGQTLTLMDGRGNCCNVELVAAHRQYATGKIINRWQEKNQALPITLIQSLPKGDKFDLILQKGTEMGVSCFQPITTEHSIPKQLTASRLSKREQRWRRIVNEAARQSRRSFLPEVAPLLSLKDIIHESGNNLKLVLWEAGASPLVKVLPDKRPEGVSLLIGPEGGFSAQEIDTAVAAGFHAVHLGPRILRTETAGLAATPVLQYLYGDWQQAPVDDTTT
jgi:16S rRNA (uracil1498-N3)-methyltransferase